jgi:hypothetical protein
MPGPERQNGQKAKQRGIRRHRGRRRPQISEGTRESLDRKLVNQECPDGQSLHSNQPPAVLSSILGLQDRLTSKCGLRIEGNPSLSRHVCIHSHHPESISLLIHSMHILCSRSYMLRVSLSDDFVLPSSRSEVFAASR